MRQFRYPIKSLLFILQQLLFISELDCFMRLFIDNEVVIHSLFLDGDLGLFQDGVYLFIVES